jgi:hypothetical protein
MMTNAELVARLASLPDNAVVRMSLWALDDNSDAGQFLEDHLRLLEISGVDLYEGSFETAIYLQGMLDQKP